MAHPTTGSKPAVRKFKGTTVFDWDSEPAAERPSEFVESVWTGGRAAYTRMASLSTLEIARARPAHKRGGNSSTLVVALLLVGAIAAGGLWALARWLPHAVR